MTGATGREGHSQPASRERVPGWDFLRGLCALAVATYHLLTWQGLADLHTFGSYGVSMFFVLSGASLAYTYAQRFEQGTFSIGEFLFVRYWRLAPLYVALMAFVVPHLNIINGDVSRLLYVLAINALFVFGLDQPSLLAILPGGWSLGVEAIYYMVFPLFLASLRSWKTAVAVLMVLLVVQAAWITITVGASWPPKLDIRYPHVPAFAAYFLGGCMLGKWQALGRPGLPSWLHALARPRVALGLFAAGFAYMLAVNPSLSGEELLGWRGVSLTALCFVLAATAGGIAARGGWLKVARHLGDATYGVYLIHPVLLFFVLPMLGLQDLKDGSQGTRVGLVLVLLAASFALALLSERYFEQPVRRWSKTFWRR